MILLLLALALLCGLFAACGKKETEPGEEDEAMEQEPIMICGQPISSYVVLKDSTTAASTLRTAVRSFADIDLSTTKTVPEDGRVIRFAADPTVSPACCRIYTDGNALVIAAYRSDYFKKAASRFGDLLTGEQVVFGEDYDETLAYPTVAYKSTMSCKLTGDSDKDPLTYAAGETAVLHVAAVSGDKIVSVPYFHVKIYNEATTKANKETDKYVKGTNGAIDVELTGSKAGFAYCNVTACDENKNALNFTVVADDGSGCHYAGSVCFNASAVTVVSQKPADHASFWQGVAAEVRAMAIETVAMEDISDREGFTTYYVALRCGTDDLGRPGVAAGYLTVPNGTGKIGLRMRFQAYGYGTPDKIYDADNAVFSVCSHSVELDKYVKGSDYYNEMYNSIAGAPGEPGFGQRTNVTRDTIYFKQMLMRDLLAARYMIERFGENGDGRWNGVDLTYGGNSMGAFQSVATAALTPLATGKTPSLVDIGIPWMCDLGGYTDGRRLSCFRPPQESAVYYYDTVYFGEMLPETCRVKIYAGLGDHICPASGVMSLYHAVRGPKTLTCESNTTHGGGWDGTEYTLQNP